LELKQRREFLFLFAVQLDAPDNPSCLINSPITQVFRYHKKGNNKPIMEYEIIRGEEKEMSKRILKPN